MHLSTACLRLAESMPWQFTRISGNQVMDTEHQDTGQEIRRLPDTRVPWFPGFLVS
jgi:hypothetical protein